MLFLYKFIMLLGNLVLDRDKNSDLLMRETGDEAKVQNARKRIAVPGLK